MPVRPKGNRFCAEVNTQCASMNWAEGSTHMVATAMRLSALPVRQRKAAQQAAEPGCGESEVTAEPVS